MFPFSYIKKISYTTIHYICTTFSSDELDGPFVQDGMLDFLMEFFKKKNYNIRTFTGMLFGVAMLPLIGSSYLGNPYGMAKVEASLITPDTNYVLPGILICPEGYDIDYAIETGFISFLFPKFEKLKYFFYFVFSS